MRVLAVLALCALAVEARISPRLDRPLCTLVRSVKPSIDQAIDASYIVQLDAWGDDSIRLRMATDEIQDVPDVQALLPYPPQPINQTIDDSTKPCSVNANTLTNGNLAVTVNDDGTFQSKRLSDGSVIVNSKAPTFQQINQLDPKTQLWAMNDPSIYQSSYSLFNIAVSYTHTSGQIYGLGEHKTGSQRYDKFSHMFEDSQVYPKSAGGDITIPWYINQAGFGVLMNQAGYGSISIDPNGATWSFNATHQFDMWITTASSSKSTDESIDARELTPFPSISRHYADVTGHPNPLPHFASGFWQSKDRYRNQSEILGIASEFHRLNVPVEVFVIDWQHWQYLGDWTFHDLKNCWQDVNTMVKQLGDYGMHTMISAWPRLDKNSIHWDEFYSNQYLTYNASGGIVYDAMDGTTVNYNPFNPSAREALWNALVDGYVKHGIHLFWLDAAEPEGSAPGTQWWSGKSDREIGMAWPLFHQKTIFEGSISAGTPEDEIIMLSRSAWVGSALYNVFVWSGDVQSSWQDLNTQVRLAPNVALSGIHWWATDIGGYFNGQYQDPGFQELLVRWFQWGQFLPVFRTHGHRVPSEENEICGGGGATNELWNYLHKDIISGVINDREAMRGYVEEHLLIASRTGIPIVQPMWYNFTDTECWSQQSEDQYMFGPKYLVAPVLAPSVTSRSVYLPKLASNEQWVHFYSGQTYTGGQRLDIPVTLADFPLFTREEKPGTIKVLDE